MQEKEQQARLYEVYALLKEVLPQASEVISWGMPTFKQQKNIIHFATFKHHIGLYPGPAAIEAFQNELYEYACSKGAIRIPHTKPLPKELIQKIALWSARHNNISSIRHNNKEPDSL